MYNITLKTYTYCTEIMSKLLFNVFLQTFVIL